MSTSLESHGPSFARVYLERLVLYRTGRFPLAERALHDAFLVRYNDGLICSSLWFKGQMLELVISFCIRTRLMDSRQVRNGVRTFPIGFASLLEPRPGSNLSLLLTEGHDRQVLLGRAVACLAHAFIFPNFLRYLSGFPRPTLRLLPTN